MIAYIRYRYYKHIKNYKYILCKYAKIFNINH